MYGELSEKIDWDYQFGAIGKDGSVGYRRTLEIKIADFRLHWLQGEAHVSHNCKNPGLPFDVNMKISVPSECQIEDYEFDDIQISESGADRWMSMDGADRIRWGIEEILKEEFFVDFIVNRLRNEFEE